MDHWVVIDDLALPLLSSHFVRTYDKGNDAGLTEEKAQELLNKLNES